MAVPGTSPAPRGIRGMRDRWLARRISATGTREDEPSTSAFVADVAREGECHSAGDGGEVDLYSALRNAAYQCRATTWSASSNGGRSSAFLSELIHRLQDLREESNDETVGRVLRLIGLLPVQQQRDALSVLHEETLGCGEDGVFASKFLEHVVGRAASVSPCGRPPREGGASCASLLRKLAALDSRSPPKERDVGEDPELLALLADVLLSRESEEAAAEAIEFLTSTVVNKPAGSAPWRRAAIEIVLNARLGPGGAGDADLDEIYSLLARHQRASLDAGAAPSRSLLRLGTLAGGLGLFRREAKEPGKRSRPDVRDGARKHLLGLLLIKLETIFGGGGAGLECRPTGIHSRMKEVLREALATCFEYWSVMNAMATHTRAVSSHHRHYAASRNLAGSADAACPVPAATEPRLKLARTERVEDKVVALRLLHRSLWYLKRSREPAKEALGLLSGALGEESLEGLSKVASLAWQPNQSRNLWLSSTQYFGSKPHVCLAMVFGLVLHFELSGTSDAMVVRAICAVVKDLEPMARLESQQRALGLQAGRVSQESVYSTILRVLLMSAFLAEARSPECVPLILSCLFEYRRKDTEHLRAVLPALGDAVHEEDLTRASGLFCDLARNFHLPIFQLKVRLGSAGSVQRDLQEEEFFRGLFSVVELLLKISGAPIRGALLVQLGQSLAGRLGSMAGGEASLANISAALVMAEGCLEVLEVLLRGCGPGLDRCGDKLKCRIEQAGMVFDFVLAKFIHLMKAHKASGGGGPEQVGVYEGVKEFVTKCIETFSIQRASKKRPPQGNGKSAGTKDAKTHRQRTAEAKAEARAKEARRRNKRLKRSSNAFVDAALRGEGYRAKEDGDLSDLEDFIVCKPGRDYDKVLAKRTPSEAALLGRIRGAVARGNEEAEEDPIESPTSAPARE